VRVNDLFASSKLIADPEKKIMEVVLLYL